MKLTTKNLNFYGKTCSSDIMEFERKDRAEWRKLWVSWKTLKFGLRDFKTREPNLPEGLSETAFCMYTGSHRLVNIKGVCKKSADTSSVF